MGDCYVAPYLQSPDSAHKVGGQILHFIALTIYSSERRQMRGKKGAALMLKRVESGSERRKNAVELQNLRKKFTSLNDPQKSYRLCWCATILCK